MATATKTHTEAWSIRQSRKALANGSYCAITGENIDRATLREWAICLGPRMVGEKAAAKEAPTAILSLCEELNGDPGLLPVAMDVAVIDAERGDVRTADPETFEP